MSLTFHLAAPFRNIRNHDAVTNVTMLPHELSTTLGYACIGQGDCPDLSTITGEVCCCSSS